MGLYEPQKGRIFIDDVLLSRENVRSWRSKIGYIPQTIYLFDGPVADNVVFGRKYDENRLISCLKKARIYDFLLTQDGIYTPVGEGGVRLSGGQKQRVAIARALYADPDILVLDEATSALDHETESKIMDEIYSEHKDKTLIVVAHRLSTVAQCNKIYKIEKGHVFLVSDLLGVNDIQKKDNVILE
jgi:ABC-type multidrug transport system fused ATPase/permease subunit